LLLLVSNMNLIYRIMLAKRQSVIMVNICT
jgi:hypothetical protein